MTINKKLFAFDLDGTLLSDSQNNIVPDKVKEMIANLIKEGHIVCIFTGRPWRATDTIYEELKLDTIVVNYNGAFIHNPTDYQFFPQIERMNIVDVIRVIETKEIQEIAKNIAIEGPRYIAIKDNNSSPFRDTFIKDDGKTEIVSPIDWTKIKVEPTGVLVELKEKYAKSVNLIKNWFDSRYGDLVEFSYWDAGHGHQPILEFTNASARKDIALRRVARFYGIEMSDTLAFGDGFNDVDMLKTAGIGVAMANASDIVKSYANVVTRKTNKEGGVATFIDWYLNQGGHTQVDKTVYKINDDEQQDTQEIQFFEVEDDKYEKKNK